MRRPGGVLVGGLTAHLSPCDRSSSYDARLLARAGGTGEGVPIRQQFLLVAIRGGHLKATLLAPQHQRSASAYSKGDDYPERRGLLQSPPTWRSRKLQKPLSLQIAWSRHRTRLPAATISGAGSSGGRWFSAHPLRTHRRPPDFQFSMRKDSAPLLHRGAHLFP